MDSKSDPGVDAEVTRSRWDLAVECVVYSWTHDGTDEFPLDVFRSEAFSQHARHQPSRAPVSY